MLKVELDIEQLNTLISNAIDSAIERHNIKNSLPPVLTREQLMEVLGVSSNKANELMKRADFPVTRVMGNPRILSHLLMQWIEGHTEWVEKNAKSWVRGA